jgi:hypothetical protein
MFNGVERESFQIKYILWARAKVQDQPSNFITRLKDISHDPEDLYNLKTDMNIQAQQRYSWLWRVGTT